MKFEKGILIVTTLCILSADSAKAVIFADQMVSDARAIRDNEDENADSVSRFGAENKKRKVSADVPELEPIAEDSFAREASRGIASVNEDGARGPAAVKMKIDTAAPKKAVIRQINREKAYQETALIANELGFFPATIFLTQGIPARIFITGASAKSQCFMLDSFGVRRQIRNQKIEEVTFTPDRSGSFEFNCPMNGAKGRVVVKELDLGIRAPASSSASAAIKPSQIIDQDFPQEFRDAQP